MSETFHSTDVQSAEEALRTRLSREDAAVESVVPVLRHLLAEEDSALLSDETVARVRGMLDHVTAQVLQDAGDEHAEGAPTLTGMLAENTALLIHVHSLALEWQLTDRLHARLALDPVLSPLMQALIASSNPATSALAMKALAAQARFCQTQRRMQLPLAELPGDLLHAVLVSFRTFAGTEPSRDVWAASRDADIRRNYDEGATRLAMLSMLIDELGSGAIAALAVTHAGVATFLSAMAFGSGLDRESAILATQPGQQARLVLGLRSAGLKPAAVEEQVLTLHPDMELSRDMVQLNAEDAVAMLAPGSAGRG